MNFKQIEGYPNYLIYEDGRVWSKNYNGGFMKPYIQNGYWKIPLSKFCKKKKFFIHRLLAIHFIPNPENKPCVDHKDGVRTNNNLSNLRWVTRKENSRNQKKAKGVYLSKKNNGKNKKWIACWCEEGKKNSKCFETEDEAISYRQAMVDIYYNRYNN